MYKVVIDANVFVSYLVFGGGNISKVFNICSNKFKICFSNELVEEIERILKIKFKVEQRLIDEFNQIICKGKIINPAINISACRDIKDNHLLELVETVNAKYLITGDQDLLVLKKWKKVSIVKPTEFVLLEMII